MKGQQRVSKVFALNLPLQVSYHVEFRRWWRRAGWATQKQPYRLFQIRSDSPCRLLQPHALLGRLEQCRCSLDLLYKGFDFGEVVA